MIIFQQWRKVLHNFWLKVDSFGVTPDMSYLQDRRVRMVNLIATWSFLCSFFYSIVNIFTDILILTAVDFTYSMLVLFVFYFHSQKRFKFARLYLLTITIIFLSTISYFSYHIAEYYLFCVLIAGILVFNDRYTHVLISVSLVLAIVLPKAFSDDVFHIGSLHQVRLLLNLPLAVFLIFFMVRHFKQIQQNYQDEIKKQQDHLEAINRDKEQLFAIIAHDIRSPLVATSQILQHMGNEFTSEEFRKQSLLQVTSQLRVMTENVDNLLHWSSQNLHGLISRPVSFNLNELLLDVLKSMEAQCKAKRIQTVIDVPADIYVFADSEQIHIILRNILSNAFKFSHKQGEVKISAKKADAAIKIAIKDWGVGMSRKKVKKLFNNLQMPSYGTSGERGTGLGLVLVNNLIQINRGEINVSSVENTGTTILLKFPAVQ